MKYRATKDFSQKLVVLDGAQVASVVEMIGKITNASKEELAKSLRMLTDELFSMSGANVQIIGSFLSTEAGDEVLLMDLISLKTHSASATFFATRDPRTNGHFNPNLNGQINPNFNGKINPNFNGKVNPNFNGKINPNFNGKINPNFNGKVNPNFNGQINPNFNGRINPNFNGKINPKINASFGGPFLYDLKNNQIGFLVQANDDVTLLFDMDAKQTGYAVKTEAGSVIFDLKGTWTKYTVAVGDDIFLVYDTGNRWIEFIV